MIFTRDEQAKINELQALLHKKASEALPANRELSAKLIKASDGLTSVMYE